MAAMSVVFKALACFLTIITSGCHFAAVQTKAPEAPPVATAEDLRPARPAALPRPREKPRPPAVMAVEDQRKRDIAGAREDTDIWALIRAGLELERDLDQRAVQDRVKWFAKKPALYRPRRRARRTLPVPHYQQTERAGYAAGSGLTPDRRERLSALCLFAQPCLRLWQFISGTGKRYGLKHNWWYDGRRDIVAATDAALDYLTMLHKRFNGNWHHALAAYNTGEGNVERAIRRNKKAGKAIDFWSLRLPRETRGYLPSLLAIAEVLHNKKHQIRFNPIPNKPYFEIIDAGSQIDLATVARLSGLTIAEVYMLNPGFNRWATDPDGPHRLLIPVARAAQFKQRLAALPASERITWKKHTIRRGESLNRIAARYQTSVSALKQTNRLKGDLIRAGQALLIPVAKQPGNYYTLSADARRYSGLKKPAMAKAISTPSSAVTTCGTSAVITASAFDN